MNIHVSELAVAKLKLYLMEEGNAPNLAFRIVPFTTGCGTPSFGIELTEIGAHQKTIQIQGIPFIEQTQFEWLDGLHIDLNRSSGKLSIYHPNPSFPSNCQHIKSIETGG